MIQLGAHKHYLCDIMPSAQHSFQSRLQLPPIFHLYCHFVNYISACGRKLALTGPSTAVFQAGQCDPGAEGDGDPADPEPAPVPRQPADTAAERGAPPRAARLREDPAGQGHRTRGLHTVRRRRDWRWREGCLS